MFIAAVFFIHSFFLRRKPLTWENMNDFRDGSSITLEWQTDFCKFSKMMNCE